jgi:hypothetical protein
MRRMKRVRGIGEIKMRHADQEEIKKWKRGGDNSTPIMAVQIGLGRRKKRKKD